MDESLSAAERQRRRDAIERMDRLAWLLDDAIRIPVLNRRIGLDGLLGLLPVGGDALGALLSTRLLWEGWRLGAPRRLQSRMLANIGIDFAVGVIPVLGDLFDFYWKTNRRNEALLRDWLESSIGLAPADAGSRTTVYSWLVGLMVLGVVTGLLLYV